MYVVCGECEEDLPVDIVDGQAKVAYCGRCYDFKPIWD
jgi:hypothetical protein